MDTNKNDILTLNERIDRIERKIDHILYAQPNPNASDSFSPFLRAMGLTPEDIATGQDKHKAPELLNTRMTCELLYEKFNRKYTRSQWREKLHYAVNINDLPIYDEDGTLRTTKTNKTRYFSIPEVIEYMTRRVGTFRTPAETQS